MLRRQIHISKKGMDWQMLTGIVIALIVCIIITLILVNKMKQVQNVNDDCEKAGGTCVERVNCAACSNIGECKAGFNRCADVQGKDMVCCPKGDVI